MMDGMGRGSVMGINTLTDNRGKGGCLVRRWEIGMAGWFRADLLIGVRKCSNDDNEWIMCCYRFFLHAPSFLENVK